MRMMFLEELFLRKEDVKEIALIATIVSNNYVLNPWGRFYVGFWNFLMKQLYD